MRITKSGHDPFSLENARTKLNRHYEKVQAENAKYKAI
jgi:hypothetical protein